jgi:hypothetical protein
MVGLEDQGYDCSIGQTWSSTARAYCNKEITLRRSLLSVVNQSDGLY